MGALCAFLFIACYYDYRFRRIPNALLGMMLITGLARSCFLYGIQGVLYFLLGMLILIVPLYPFFKLGALGAGDIKLFGVCAGYLSYDKILYFLFVSLLIAAIFSLIKLIIERNAKERMIYMGDYFLEVVRRGHWQLYMDNEKDCREMTIPLAGPIFCGVLLYMGGVY